jgi:disulfide bond formation protein DsbB
VSVALVETFYALLALVALTFVGVLLVVRLLETSSGSARGAYRSAAEAIEPHALGLAFLVALLATVGSLYFSEIAGFEPCRLCWYQRIAMYPLVIILGIAAMRRDRDVAMYVRVLAGIGAVIAGYHLALEWIPALDTGACGTGPACTVVWFRALGFVSLPMMALSAFLAIVAILSVRSGTHSSEEEA